MAEDETLLASVVDHLPLGVWIARAPTGEFVFANRVFREIMGMEARPDVAAGCYAEPYGIFTRTGEPYPETRMPFVRALTARAAVTVDDIAIHRTDGKKVMIHATARPIFDAAGQITHVVIAFEDVTAQVEAEAARNASEEKLRQARRLEALGTLAAGIAHDFNNLLASIRVLASLLRMSEREPSRRADLARIEEVTAKAARLTGSLLNFGRQGGGHRVTQLSVPEVASGVVELVKRTFDRRIAVRYEAAAPRGVVSADPVQLEQLFMNLALNARDVMPDGGTLRVSVRDVDLAAPAPPLRPGPHVLVEVADTGPGVPAELRERIFEPYFTTKLHRSEPGAGLGLATAYRVVSASGGTIEIADAEPQGAIFRVYLPAATADVAQLPAPPVDEARAGSGTVLLVEDDPTQRGTERRALEQLGYDVVEASDGVEALELFRAHAGALRAVVLDLVMPRLSGRDAWTEMHRLAPEVPVLMTSGQIGPELRAAVHALGVPLLPKPFGVHELANAMAQAIEKAS